MGNRVRIQYLLLVVKYEKIWAVPWRRRKNRGPLLHTVMHDKDPFCSKAVGTKQRPITDNGDVSE